MLRNDALLAAIAVSYDAVVLPANRKDFDLLSQDVCGVTDSGSIVCERLGPNPRPQRFAPQQGSYVRVALRGSLAVCGLTNQGRIECWFREEIMEDDWPNQGDYEQIAASRVDVHRERMPQGVGRRAPLDPRAREPCVEPPLDLSHGDSPPAACQKERARRSSAHEATEIVAHALREDRAIASAPLPVHQNRCILEIDVFDIECDRLADA